MFLSQELYNLQCTKTQLERELKGNPELIQKKLNEVIDLLNKEENQTCIRPVSIRGPMYSAKQKYLMEKEILETMLKEANTKVEPACAKPC